MSDFPYLLISNPSQVLRKGSTGLLGWRRPDALRPRFRGPKPLAQLVPRDQWAAKIAAGGSGLPALIAKLGVQAKNQNGLNYCWVYGSTRGAELERDRQGNAHLELSPESVGGPLTNWSNQGGYAAEAFGQLQTYGACEESFLDAPCSLNSSLWKPGWQANAAQHEAVDWYDIETSDQNPSFDEVVSILLAGQPVACGLDWWSHLVCFIDAMILPPAIAQQAGVPVNTPTGDVVVVLFQNSWGVDWPTPGANGFACLTEKLGTPDGAASPILVQPGPPGPPQPVPGPDSPSRRGMVLQERGFVKGIPIETIRAKREELLARYAAGEREAVLAELTRLEATI
jgi:hypothetical protein